jgi:hypothetical protein
MDGSQWKMATIILKPQSSEKVQYNGNGLQLIEQHKKSTPSVFYQILAFFLKTMPIFAAFYTN